MVVVGIVYVDTQVTLHRCGDSLVPNRAGDSSEAKAASSCPYKRDTGQPWFGHRKRGIKNDIGDVVRDVFILDLDEVSFSGDGDLDRLDRLARGMPVTATIGPLL